jgi:hypothetical protein
LVGAQCSVVADLRGDPIEDVRYVCHFPTAVQAKLIELC